MRTRILAACVLPLLLLALAGCSKPDEGPAVASADRSARPSPTPSVSRLELLTRLSQCMREHGVPMTDPLVDGDNIRAGRYDKGAVSAETEIKAEEACQQFRPPRDTGPGAAAKDELARQFSRCMREHGVEQFPDPNPTGATRIGEEIHQDPQYDEARAFCDAQANAAAASINASLGATK